MRRNKMTQYVICKIKLSKDITWSEVRSFLQKKGCEVQTTGMFIQLQGFPVPKRFNITRCF